MILILFTASYPYASGSEQTFLRMELPHLMQAFERVILVPEKPDSEAMASDVPGVEVEDSYKAHIAKFAGWRTFIQGLVSALTAAEIRSMPWLLLKPVYLKRLLHFAGQAELTRSWAIAWINRQKLDPEACLFYTYWFDQSALGIGLARRSLRGLRTVSRAHGYDVYEDRRDPPYWPCRAAALEAVDLLYPDSEAGTNHLRERYPRYGGKIRTALLGVPDPLGLSPASKDGTYRIVSCSRILAVKRVRLILEGIKVAAERRSSQRFDWCHFGTGPLEPELNRAMASLPSNMTATLAGYSSQGELMDFYRGNPVDVFMNLSASEGTPVAVMEAISCGIPVIATAVGGNVEIASEQNGCLLSPDPSAEDVADALLALLDHPCDRRAGSRALWARRYDAGLNYPDFVADLIALRAS